MNMKNIYHAKRRYEMENPRLEQLNKEHRTAEIRLTREKHR